MRAFIVHIFEITPPLGGDTQHLLYLSEWIIAKSKMVSLRRKKEKEDGAQLN